MTLQKLQSFALLWPCSVAKVKKRLVELGQLLFFTHPRGSCVQSECNGRSMLESRIVHSSRHIAYITRGVRGQRTVPSG
jgi:hypothetical protein